MSQQIIPLDNSPNQTFSVSVNVNGAAATFFLALRYNEISGYWALSISDSNQSLLLSGIPLVTGVNLLRQYQYLGIGSLYVLNATGEASDSPDDTDLGTGFVLAWTDNIGFVAVAAA